MSRDRWLPSRRRGLLWAAAMLSAGPLQAPAAGRVARVGWMGWTGASWTLVPLEALRAGLADLGWKEGDNLTLESRSGGREQAGELTADLVRARVEVIVVVGPMVFAARGRTGNIPLVFNINGDPVEAGLVASLARPGGLLTGITALSTDLTGKRLELLKTLRPDAGRVAVLGNDRHPGWRIELQATERAAKRLGLALKFHPVAAAGDFEAAFAAIARDAPSAVLAIPDTLINEQAAAIAQFATRHRLPAISGWAEFALAGNVMSYGPVQLDFFRQSASYVDRILRGARAAELPVEQPKRFELVLNLKAARATGVAVPENLRLRADRVIE